MQFYFQQNIYCIFRNYVDLWPLPSDEEDSDDHALQFALENSLCDDGDEIR